MEKKLSDAQRIAVAPLVDKEKVEELMKKKPETHEEKLNITATIEKFKLANKYGPELLKDTSGSDEMIHLIISYQSGKDQQINWLDFIRNHDLFLRKMWGETKGDRSETRIYLTRFSKLIFIAELADKLGIKWGDKKCIEGRPDKLSDEEKKITSWVYASAKKLAPGKGTSSGSWRIRAKDGFTKHSCLIKYFVGIVNEMFSPKKSEMEVQDQAEPGAESEEGEPKEPKKKLVLNDIPVLRNITQRGSKRDKKKLKDYRWDDEVMKLAMSSGAILPENMRPWAAKWASKYVHLLPPPKPPKPTGAVRRLVPSVASSPPPPAMKPPPGFKYQWQIDLEIELETKRSQERVEQERKAAAAAKENMKMKDEKLTLLSGRTLLCINKHVLLYYVTHG